MVKSLISRFLGRKPPRPANSIGINSAEISRLKGQRNEAREAAYRAAKDGGHLEALADAVLEKVSR